jgi:hypothetical protein
LGGNLQKLSQLHIQVSVFSVEVVMTVVLNHVFVQFPNGLVDLWKAMKMMHEIVVDIDITAACRIEVEQCPGEGSY